MFNFVEYGMTSPEINPAEWDELMERVDSGDYALAHSCKMPTEDDHKVMDPLHPAMYGETEILCMFLYGPKQQDLLTGRIIDAMNN